jgi:hypothetical protein
MSLVKTRQHEDAFGLNKSPPPPEREGCFWVFDIYPSSSPSSHQDFKTVFLCRISSETLEYFKANSLRWISRNADAG